MLRGIQGIPEFLGPSNRSHLKHLLEILSPSLQTHFIDCANRIPGGYLTDSISGYCCFGQVNRGLEGQGTCRRHSGTGPHALLWSFLVAVLLPVLLLLIPARPIKPQCLLFSSAFCALACFPRSSGTGGPTVFCDLLSGDFLSLQLLCRYRS